MDIGRRLLLAERAAALGGTPHGTIWVGRGCSFLVPSRLGVADEHQHLFAISGTSAALEQSVRDAVGKATAFSDPDTANLRSEWADANRVASELQERIATWVNEGGGGDDLDQREAGPMFDGQLTC